MRRPSLLDVQKTNIKSLSFLMGYRLTGLPTSGKL